MKMIIGLSHWPGFKDWYIPNLKSGFMSAFMLMSLKPKGDRTHAHISDTTCLYIASYTSMCKNSLYSYWNTNLAVNGILSIPVFRAPVFPARLQHAYTVHYF